MTAELQNLNRCDRPTSSIVENPLGRLRLRRPNRQALSTGARACFAGYPGTALMPHLTRAIPARYGAPILLGSTRHRVGAERQFGRVFCCYAEDGQAPPSRLLRPFCRLFWRV